MFFRYGESEVLPGVTFEDLIKSDLTYEESQRAIRRIQTHHRDLLLSSFRDHPEIQDRFIDFESAKRLSMEGALVLTGHEPGEDGAERRYFVCPESLQSDLNELNMAARLVTSSNGYLDGQTSFLESMVSRQVAAGDLEVVGRLAPRVRFDGTGIDLLDEAGTLHGLVNFPIPGVVTGLSSTEN